MIYLFIFACIAHLKCYQTRKDGGYIFISHVFLLFWMCSNTFEHPLKKKKNQLWDLWSFPLLLLKTSKIHELNYIFLFNQSKEIPLSTLHI